MDINELKYNQALLENQKKLKKELEFVNNEIVERQSKCNHLTVCIERNMYNTYDVCLFCGKSMPNRYGRYIDAQDYKKMEYCHDSRQMYIKEKRRIDLLNLWIKIQTENPNMSEEQIIEEIESIVKRDKEEAKVMKITFK